MEVIKEKLETVIGQNSLEEVNEITSTIVKQACAKMKPGEMDVSERERERERERCISKVM